MSDRMGGSTRADDLEDRGKSDGAVDKCEITQGSEWWNCQWKTEGAV